MYDEDNSYPLENESLDSTANQPVDMTMKLPAKSHLNKLEDILVSINNDLEESKKNIQKMRGEFLYLGFKNNDNNSEMSTFIVNEAIKITNNFKKLMQDEIDENNKTKQQVNMLIQDRVKLQQETLVLENRIFEFEKDLGYKQDL